MTHTAENDARQRYPRPDVDGPCSPSADGWCFACSTGEGPMYHDWDRVIPPAASSAPATESGQA